MHFESSRNPGRKLTGEVVAEIREKYAVEGWSQGRLARAYGISVNQIGRIVRGECWQNVANAGLTKVNEPPPTAEEIDASAARMMAWMEAQKAQAIKQEITPPVHEVVRELSAGELEQQAIERIRRREQSVADMQGKIADKMNCSIDAVKAKWNTFADDNAARSAWINHILRTPKDQLIVDQLISGTGIVGK